MYKIRRGLFETNSSSTHTLVCRKFKLSKPRFKLNNGVLTTKFLYLYEPFGRLSTQSEKLSYLVTRLTGWGVAEKSDFEYVRDKLYDSGAFQELVDELKEYIPGMTALEVKPSRIYLDHQIVECNCTDISDVLGYWIHGGIPITAVEFIFCDDIVVEEGHD